MREVRRRGEVADGEEQLQGRRDDQGKGERTRLELLDGARLVAASSAPKESLDRKLGGPYNVVVGESFSLEIDYVKSTLFYMYFGGYLAVLIWKCV